MKAKEKEKQDLQIDQSANLEQTIVTTKTQSIIPIVTFQIEEVKAQQTDTSLPSLNSSGVPAIFTIEKDGTEVHTGQEARHIPTP